MQTPTTPAKRTYVALACDDDLEWRVPVGTVTATSRRLARLAANERWPVLDRYGLLRVFAGESVRRGLLVEALAQDGIGLLDWPSS